MASGFAGTSTYSTGCLTIFKLFWTVESNSSIHVEQRYVAH